MDKILGIDYGKAKIGLAMADSETRIAFSYGTLKNDKDFLQKLAGIIKKENVSLAVIGMPGFGSQGNRGMYQEFGEELKKALPEIEIRYVDEMFTTKMAQEKLKEKGIKNVQELDDQEAARIILESWLDNSRNA